MPFRGLASAFDDPVIRTAHTIVDQSVWSPDLEPPIFAVLFVHLAHGASEVERLSNAFLYQGGATWRLHHGGSHIAAGNDAVLGAGAGVHQIRFIEQMPIQLVLLRVLHQNMAGLADTRQKFVNRLRRIDHRVHWACAFLTHRVVCAVKGVKCRVGQPSFVKMQVRNVAIQHLFDGLGVVEHAVVGGLGNRQHAWNRFFRIHTL